jgi:hypothetical protein
MLNNVGNLSSLSREKFGDVTFVQMTPCHRYINATPTVPQVTLILSDKFSVSVKYI